MNRPFVTLAAEAPSPLVLSSPHSGRAYPDDFGFVCPLPALRQAEDAFVDELIAGAAEAGVAIIQARFPRSYIDVNRAGDDLDPAVLASAWPGPLNPSPRTLQGLGLVRRLCRSGVPMYEAPLPVAEVQKRVAACYRPYHAALELLMAGRKKTYGEAWLIDCHSMPGPAGHNGARSYPDFVLGDRDGASCDPAFTRLVQDALQESGYSVVLNDPYKGVEIVRRHGRPHERRHALQLEINRRLYIDEQTLEKNRNFARLRGDLSRLFETLTKQLTQMTGYNMAAE